MKQLLQIGSAISALFALLLFGIVAAMLVAAWEVVGQAGAVLVWFALGAFIVAGCAWLGGFIFRRLARMDMARSEARLKRIEVKDADRQSEFTAAVMVATIPQIQAGLTFPSHLNGITFSAHTKGAIQHMESIPWLTEPNLIKPILPELVSRQRILIVGPSDSGKTTLLRHLIDAKGDCLVIDPHGTPPKWGQARHIGQGRDYRAIGAALNWLIGEMNKRYEQLGTGEVLEGQHPKVTIIIDEWRAIVKNVKNAGDHISSLLTEARKANMDLVVASHSQMVKALGVEGEGDLRQGFSVVTLSGGNGEDRAATLSTNGSDPVEYALPGPYHEKTFNEQIAVKLLPADVDTMERAGTILDLGVAPATEAGFIAQQVIDEYLKTASYSAAFRLLYQLENGSDYKGAIGGNQTGKVKDILDRHNIAHPISK